MAYGSDLFQQKRATPYMGPTTVPPVVDKLPTVVPPPPPPKPIAGGTNGGTVGGGFIPMGARDLTGPPLPYNTFGQPKTVTDPLVVKPGFTTPLPGSSSPTFVQGTGQGKIDLLGNLGVRKTAAQLTTGAARNAYQRAYKREGWLSGR